MRKFEFTILLIFFFGCYSNTMQQKANVAALHNQLLTEKELNFLTYDKSEYLIKVKYMDERILKGTGKRKQNIDAEWEEFAGEVVLDSIDILRFSQRDAGKSLLINSTALTLLIKGLMAGEGPVQPTIEFVHPPGSSCPFIYSLQGENYILEGEAFGIALGKAREMTTATVLSLNDMPRKEIKIRIANERPETHFINQVGLETYTVDKEALICADNEQSIWPVYEMQPPQNAFERGATNIWQEISKKDNCYWRSQSGLNTRIQPFQDEIQLVFNRPSGAMEFSLIIDAINTYFGNYAFEQIFGFLGDQSLSFMQQIENDATSIELMENWARESALKVYIWDGTGWSYSGMIFPEANVTPFSRLVRIKVPRGNGEQVRIKLVSLADVWKIDAVQADWTPVQKVRGEKITLITAEGPFAEELSDRLSASDARYAVLFPSQKIDLSFNSPARIKNKKCLYVLRTGGYLYEWLPPEDGISQFASLDPLNNFNKVEWVKALLQRKNLLLPLLYSGWRLPVNQRK